MVSEKPQRHYTVYPYLSCLVRHVLFDIPGRHVSLVEGAVSVNLLNLATVLYTTGRFPGLVNALKVPALDA